MKRFALVCLLVLPACAPLLARPREANGHQTLWRQAHSAFAADSISQAQELFAELSRAYPQTGEGHDALFHAGALLLDPRNPNWEPQAAARLLRQYVETDTAGSSRGRFRIPRRPEAITLLELAEELNLPSENRIEGLQATDTVRVRAPGSARPTTRPASARQRRVVSAAESRAALAVAQAAQTEARELRRQLRDREEQLTRQRAENALQREELERIRRTLTGRP